MIRLWRADLPNDLAEELSKKTVALTKAQADGEAARKKWKNAKACKGRLRDQLGSMAAGVERCMYCGDSMGTDVDHFEPIFLAPFRTFEWLNHLLACSHCNSHEKRESFPRTEEGAPLLIDPTSEEPTEHLLLVLSTGAYEALTTKGESVIEIFGLNRQSLVRGRRSAFVTSKAVLQTYLRQHEDGLLDEAAETATELDYQPFADVRAAMRWTRQNVAPENAEVILGGPVVVRALDLLPPFR
ncbi:HNH endonuclease family protein [Nocardiopsis valliformis]|uniref:HNH endonuclease n=1 Tax=Nocardiopsis valliformis TaxID=239974 RepID=UPI001EFA03C5|nr:HNH endonuclease [Nocardiopsis valliformis]